MNKYEPSADLAELLVGLIDDDLDTVRLARLGEMLRNDAAARNYYYEFVQLHTLLTWEKHPTTAQVELAQDAIGQLDVEEPEHRVTFLARVAASSHKLSRPRALVASIAAALVIGLLLTAMYFMVPPIHRVISLAGNELASPVLIAELSGLHQAVWAEGQIGTFVGARLMSAHPVHLQAGLAEFTFTDGTRVTLEGPVEMELTSQDAVKLTRGKLTAVIGARKESFLVETPAGTITDRGTEFAVQVDENGTADVFVFAGVVEARLAGETGANKVRTLRRGESTRLQVGTHRLAASGVRGEGFVRSIPRQPRQRRIRLAEIVGGSNVRGRASPLKAIDMSNGTATDERESKFAVRPNLFVPVDHNPWIDGVFVPDGEQGRQVQITSTGIAFDGFQDTDGRSWGHLWCGPINADFSTVLSGVDYASPGHSLLTMHANKGLTFDLTAIRRVHRGWRIEQFRAAAGNSRGSVDFLVLLDGTPVFAERRHAESLQGVPIRLQIPSEARFLTLVVTDAGDEYWFDRAIFGDPMLILVAEDSQARGAD